MRAVRREQATLLVPLESDEDKLSYLEIAERAREEQAHAYSVVALGCQHHLRVARVLAARKAG